MSERLPIRCPGCDTVNDGHSGALPDALPVDGDVGICWSCRGLLVFTLDDRGCLGARLPTPAELVRLEADADIRRFRAAMSESYRPTEAVDLIRERP